VSLLVCLVIRKTRHIPGLSKPTHFFGNHPPSISMSELITIYDYMRANSHLLGERILRECPALHQFDEPVSLVGLISGKQLQFSSDMIARGSRFPRLAIRFPYPCLLSNELDFVYAPR